MTPQDTFEKNYWLSKNPRIVETYKSQLRSTKMERQNAFQILATELHNERLEAQGDLVDYPIMVELKSPYVMMVEIRKPAGYTWVPNALQNPIGNVPGIAIPNVQPLPGQIPYDPTRPPPQSILVLTDAAEYKPYVATPQPTS
jgi:hypothetical protein